MNLYKIAVDMMNKDIKRANDTKNCRICGGSGIMLVANFEDDVDREPCHCVT